jgi:HK97 family phage major capsid protein
VATRFFRGPIFTNWSNHEMRTASQYREEIRDLRDELDSITAVAEREERDLNEEEGARCTEITEKLIPALNRGMQTVMKIEAERNQRVTSRAEDELKRLESQGSTSEPLANGNISRFHSMKIPAKAKAHGPLRAYHGEGSDKAAFVAGNVILAAIGSQSAQKFCRDYGLQVSASMGSSENSNGGFLVPDEMQSTLIRLRESRGVFPRFANRVPMGADIIRVPRLLADVVAYWTGEKQEITPSDPTLGGAELMARKLAALTKVSSELDEDAVIEVGDMITESMAYAMADKIDEAAFNGDGTSTYGGVLGLKNALSSNAIHDALANNTGAGTLDLDDFQAVVGKFPDYPGASPRWFMNRAVYYASARRLMDAAGGNTNLTLANGVSEEIFLGYPVTFVQVLPNTTGASASTILAYFGDLRLSSSYGTRRSARTEVTLDRYFEEDMIGIKTTERIAINNHERGDTIRNRPVLALKTAS